MVNVYADELTLCEPDSNTAPVVGDKLPDIIPLEKGQEIIIQTPDDNIRFGVKCVEINDVCKDMNKYDYQIIKYTRSEEEIIGEDFKPAKIIKWTATEMPQIEYMPNMYPSYFSPTGVAE